MKEKVRRIKSNLKKSKKKRSNKPFNLQNSPRKYSGYTNTFFYNANIHNLIYKGGHFQNVKFQASNITNCNFKMTTLIGVDFVGCNLRESDFSGAVLENIIFMNCKLKKAKFSNCHLKNVYFIMTDIEECIEMPDNAIILKKYPNINDEDIEQEVFAKLAGREECIRYHVLHVKRNKINYWMVDILLKLYGKDGIRALSKLAERPILRNQYTLYSYMRFIESYLHL